MFQFFYFLLDRSKICYTSQLQPNIWNAKKLNKSFNVFLFADCTIMLINSLRLGVRDRHLLRLTTSKMFKLDCKFLILECSRIFGVTMLNEIENSNLLMKIFKVLKANPSYWRCFNLNYGNNHLPTFINNLRRVSI